MRNYLKGQFVTHLSFNSFVKDSSLYINRSLQRLCAALYNLICTYLPLICHIFSCVNWFTTVIKHALRVQICKNWLYQVNLVIFVVAVVYHSLFGLFRSSIRHKDSCKGQFDIWPPVCWWRRRLSKLSKPTQEWLTVQQPMSFQTFTKQWYKMSCTISVFTGETYYQRTSGSFVGVYRACADVYRRGQ